MRVLGGLARVVGAAAVALLILGLPVLLLSTPPVTRALVNAYYDPTSSGLPLDTALVSAEKVRVYVTDTDSPPLPTEVAGRPAFDEAASSHLLDVRRVLLAARALTSAAALVAAALLAAALTRGRRRGIAWSLSVGALTVLALAVFAIAFGALDFGRFFAAFHGLFFASGTWTFPYGALLIELFPEPLWATLAGLWAGSVLLAGAACVIAARVLRAKMDSHDRVYV